MRHCSHEWQVNNGGRGLYELTQKLQAWLRESMPGQDGRISSCHTPQPVYYCKKMPIRTCGRISSIILRAWFRMAILIFVIAMKELMICRRTCAVC